MAQESERCSSTKASLEVRALRDDELEGALALGGQFFVDRGLPGQFSLSRSCETWRRLAALYPAALLAVLEQDRVVGGIGIATMPDLFSDYRYAAEAFFFVLPAYRRLGCGERLLEAAEEWTAAYGVAEFRVAAYHVDDWALLERWYRKRGYKPFMTMFRKQVTHVSL